MYLTSSNLYSLSFFYSFTKSTNLCKISCSPSIFFIFVGTSLIQLAFESIEDPVGSGRTTFDTLESEIDTNVEQGEDLLNEMDRMLEETGNNDITQNDFTEYYRTISASIDGDRKFENSLRTTFLHLDTRPQPPPVKTSSSRNSRTSRNSNTSRRSNASRGNASRGNGSRGNGSRGNGSRGNKKENDALARFRREKKRPDLANNEGMIRLMAANHLQAVFRGHKGRNKVDYERRKKEQLDIIQKQEEKERDVEKKRLKRTVAKHNPRFKAARR